MEYFGSTCLVALYRADILKGPYIEWGGLCSVASPIRDLPKPASTIHVHVYEQCTRMYEYKTLFTHSAKIRVYAFVGVSHCVKVYSIIVYTA